MIRTRQAIKNISLRRLSTATSTSSSQALKTPPVEARGKQSSKTASEDVNLPIFNAKEWSTSVPIQKSRLVALANRLGLSDIPIEELEIACTHKSCDKNKNNEQYEQIGNTFLGMLATEHVHVSYPHLPLKPLKAAVSMLVGPKTCAGLSREWGAQSTLRWSRQDDSQTYLHEDAMSSLSKSIVGLILKHKGIKSAYYFTQSFFLSRSIDLRALLKFDNPVTVLSHTAKKFGYNNVDVKLLKETGRYTQSPVYIVGVFADDNLKLGEGFGSSLKMAKYRAANNALQQLYLHYRPSDSLPSATLFDEPYNSLPLGKSEVLFKSA
ncbi:ribonuclease III [Wallemia mellicola CBS 633.66]|uniref:Large ribosomal subunit protein mL44 n=1 Tax=Wallemia mellicola (strain ATCC MYA-4683 / CBS 633.66) TaxID=671144 RepID=I4Y5N5_WALMC|nr:ribonuclease III [Wallemia mellicola CBS 633.66]EIM19277.1 ribonuclease III [Wallemia mellicola CBS 633.66]|eukprot:XP_006960671.1 ribonuclease III [Wallemia mellicola CBS 633.66]